MNYSNFKIASALAFGLLFFCILSCQKDAQINIEQLKGYWEIDFINQQGETFNPTSITPLYDYYAIENQSGFYKKVAPAILGSFQTSEDATLFKIEQNDTGSFLRFKTPWDEWEKKIIQLDSQKLILKHEKRTFHYKRPIFINSNP